MAVECVYWYQCSDFEVALLLAELQMGSPLGVTRRHPITITIRPVSRNLTREQNDYIVIP